MSISIETLALAKKYSDKVGSGFTNVSFDQTTKSIVFTLKDGTKRTFKVDNMVTDDQIKNVVNHLIALSEEDVNEDTIIKIITDSETPIEIPTMEEFLELKDEVEEHKNNHPVGGGSSSSDWNENDEEAEGYIKNRTHYVEVKNTYDVDPNEMWVDSGEDEIGSYEFYSYYIDSVKLTNSYENINSFFEEMKNNVVIRNGDSIVNLGEPFLLQTDWSDVVAFGNDDPYSDDFFYGQTEPSLSVLLIPSTYQEDDSIIEFDIEVGSYEDISNLNIEFLNGIVEPLEIIHQIDNKYINGNFVRSGTGSLSEIFNDGRNVATGTFSHAEGCATEARGHSSHVEGGYTKALGQSSHAEGNNSKAYGDYSHVEGSGTAAYFMSHAESGECSALAPYSHAEGEHTTTYSPNCHVEGAYNYAERDGITNEYDFERIEMFDENKLYKKGDVVLTKEFGGEKNFIPHVCVLDEPESALGNYYRINDETSKCWMQGLVEHQYLHVIGNGYMYRGRHYRSNAHTVDRKGNAWYAGDVYIGSTSGTHEDEGAKRLATIDEVNELIKVCTQEEYDAITEKNPNTLYVITEG